MKSEVRDDGAHQPLVVADLFFGLGAVLLIVVAAISLSLQGMLQEALSANAATSADTRKAAVQLSAQTGARLLVTRPDGLDLIAPDAPPLPVNLRDIASVPALGPLQLADAPLLVIAPDGQEAAFLLYARLGRTQGTALPAVRLTEHCTSLRQTDLRHVVCQP